MKVASGRAAYRGARRGRGASRAGGREEEPVWISLRNRTLTPEQQARASAPGSGSQIPAQADLGGASRGTDSPGINGVSSGKGMVPR